MTRTSLAATAVLLMSLVTLMPSTAAAQQAFTVVEDSKYTPPAPPPPPVQVWVAEGTLRSTLSRWAKEAGWAEPRWDAPVDYPIVGVMKFEGEFVDAVTDIFETHANVPRPLKADVYVSQKFILVTE